MALSTFTWEQHKLKDAHIYLPSEDKQEETNSFFVNLANFIALHSRRILENYFKFLGGIELDDLVEHLEEDEPGVSSGILFTLGFLNILNIFRKIESDTYHRYKPWLVEVEKIGMAKSYKMVVLIISKLIAINAYVKVEWKL